MKKDKFGLATLYLIKRIFKGEEKKHEIKFHPENIVVAKLQVTLSDGSVHLIEADVLSLEWETDDEKTETVNR